MKRFAALVLPDLACELARVDGVRGSCAAVDDSPFAVIVDDDPSHGDDIAKNAVLDAVDARAWQYGARPGQTAAQAAAFVGQLKVVRIARARVLEALGCVAEMALGFGTTAAIELGRGDHLDDIASAAKSPSRAKKGAKRRSFVRYPGGAGAGPYDTVWLDVSGCARLSGGEDMLCADLRERAAELGHRARVAIASGPRIARAVARWASPSSPSYGGELVVARDRDAAMLAELPIAALPLSLEIGSWLLKLGLLRIDDLAKLDRKRLSHRLGNRARDLLELLAGRDDVPLIAHTPPRSIIESACFEQAIDGSEPLSFVLRGLTAHAVARLSARGEACSLASLRLDFDRSVIALQHRYREEGVSREAALPNQMCVNLSLPVPLAREEELTRALRAKIERLTLPAPIVQVSLVLDGLVPLEHHQLNMGRSRNDPHALPMLLAELSAWVGAGQLGVLSMVDSHRPEARSQLVPVSWRKSPSDIPLLLSFPTEEPTRILPQPIDVGRLAPDALVSIEPRAGAFLIDRLRLSARIDQVGWWSRDPVSRDYARAWLHRPSDERGRSEYGEAWMFVDRQSGHGYLHGWYE
jgi:protein ImuB